MLSDSISAAVPLWISELEALGGPDDSDLRQACEVAGVLAERGEGLIFGGAGAAGLFNRFARAIAVLAFTPGGVTVFGRHYEGGHHD